MRPRSRPDRFATPATLGGRLVFLSSASLVVAAVLVFALITYQQQRLLRAEWLESLSAQASLIATNSMAAVSFSDRIEASRLLAAVASSPAVVHARLILPNGETFASFARTPDIEARPRPASSSGHAFDATTLTVWMPVHEGWKEQATVELTSSLEPMHRAFRRTAFETVGVLVCALLLSLWLSRRVVRRLSAPIAELSALMRRLVQDTALPDRASANGDDEVAELGRGFNRLIDTVQVRDRELAEYRDNLERLVEQRTQALERAIEDARHANAAKSTFLARMSHEIRTPMNAIVGFGKLLTRTPLDRRQREHLDKMLLASESLLGVIDDVLDYSRIEAGMLSLETIPFDPAEVIDKALGVVALAAESKGLELIARIDSEVPRRVLGDPLRLGQILINLAGNAVKFTEQGEVVITVGRTPADAGDADIGLVFSVRDTGIGIPAEHRSTLFAPFTQIDDSVTRRFGGTGLGLTICAQLVRLMGGAIELESTPGSGTTFRFSVRVAADPSAGHAPPLRAALAGRRALVIDDNASARDALCRTLADLGLVTESAGDAAEGLARMRDAVGKATRFEVVLIDWAMPRVDGLQAARDIQAGASTLGAPKLVLMIGPSGYEAVANHTRDAGINQLLVKPISESALCEAILESFGANIPAATDTPTDDTAMAPVFDFTGIRGAGVLVVDDVALNRQVAREFLDEAGLRVIEAANGREAIERLAQEDIALVLMDIQMPVMDGLAATRAIRANPRYRDLPIVAMTAHAMVGDREQSLAARMNDHLTKPIDPNVLFNTLLRWIPAGNRTAPAGPDTSGRPEPDQPLPPLRGIDIQRGLANHMGRSGFYRRTLIEFARAFARCGDEITLALAGTDHTTARRRAHSIKSAAATIGAETLSLRARALEDALAQHRDPAPALATLAPALTEVMAALAPLAAPERQAAHGASTDTGAVLAVMARLESMLRRHDAATTPLLDELSACLGDDSWSSTLAQLRDLVEDVEHEQALALLEHMRALLTGAQG
ncbi:MAG TPA: response regulator [Rhodocyclaceae bacterium]|nr:response regulator [Rhodocyclaceae bacterium]